MRAGAVSVGAGRAAVALLLTALLLGLALPAGAAAASGPSTSTSPPSTSTAPKPTTATHTTTTPTATTPKTTTPVFTIPTNPAATPPMGWDSWDAFGCNVNQHDVVQAANWLVATGLRDAGYRYVIVDDCWYNPTRSTNGSLRGNGTTFPNGMRWLGWYLHSHGLLFGLYASAGTATCAQLNHIYPGTTGSLGHEQQDAQTFASWGVDYLKYDQCSAEGTVWDQITAFTRMRDALEATGRHILYSINPNSFHLATGARNWGAVANDVRVGTDLAPFWDTGSLSNWYSGIVNAVATDEPLWPRAKPGIWNDPDSLVVGLQPAQYAAAVGSQPLAALLSNPPAPMHNNLSFQAMRTNFAMWAMLAAPLTIGADVPFLTQPELKILLNKRLIAVDQDPLGRQGHPIRSDQSVWAKRLTGGAVAAALFNPSDTAQSIATNARQLGLPWASKYQITDLWTGANSTTKGLLSAVVPAHGVAVFQLMPIVKPPASTRSTPAGTKPTQRGTKPKG